MLGQPFESLPAEVEAVEVGVRRLKPGDDADGVRIVIEPSRIGERGAVISGRVMTYANGAPSSGGTFSLQASSN